MGWPTACLKHHHPAVFCFEIARLSHGEPLSGNPAYLFIKVRCQCKVCPPRTQVCSSQAARRRRALACPGRRRRLGLRARAATATLQRRRCACN